MNTDDLETTIVGTWIRIRLPRGEWFFDQTRPLGPAGGFGAVFEGRNASGDSVAVKRLHVSAADAAHRELEIAEELQGKSFKHLLDVLDSGQDAEAGAYYVIMPRADRSLADHLRAHGIPPPAEAVEILSQIAEGIRELPGVVHRDLKPGNVLFHDGRWKIADFGIARFVEEATSARTLRECLSPPYAAPEQWIGERATGATDVYALSCIGYVLLKGEPPFPGPSNDDYQRQHRSETPPTLGGVDVRLRAILSAGLRKPQSGRPTITRMIDVLRDVSSNPSRPPAGIAALQAANASEAQRISDAAAKAARDRLETEKRNAVIAAGAIVLQDVMRRITEVARQNASESVVNASGTGPLQIALGGAELRFESQGAVPPNAMFLSAKWEAFAIGRIDVKQTKPHAWSHGATLWYMQFPSQSACRWYEVSYKRNAFYEGPIVGPFAIQDVGDDVYRHADAAAGPGMHVIELEAQPRPIDDEDVEAFVERWLDRLAQAYNGRLRPF
jgi:serine/threonine-protein kinase